MSEQFLAGIHEQTRRQLQNGREFVLDAPTTIPAVWGAGTDVAWASGESLFITGPQGVGKSLVAQRLALARAGIIDAELLGYPVAADLDHCVLYLAADRPQQIARSFRRMVGPEHADALEQRLKVWTGPLPFDLVKEPQRLAMLAEAFGAGTLFVDSLKDIAYPLSSDEVGAAVNRAFGTVIAAGIELVPVHHNRKATAENKKPTSLADVYGSTWITAGAGSVISLWGEAGDPLVELTHLKQPADDIGPLEIEHDHVHGSTRLRQRIDALSVLKDAGSEGIAVQDAAALIYGRSATRPQVEKVRRKLQRFADEGLAKPVKGPTRTDPVVFRLVAHNSSVKPREVSREASRQPHAASRTPANTDHASITHPNDHRATPLKGARDQEREATLSADAEYERLTSKFGEIAR